MKKTIAIITLTLLMVVSLFAKTVTPATAGATTVSSNNTTTTTVELTLSKTPTYIFGINTAASITINENDVPATTIADTATIQLERYTSTDSGKNVLDVKPNTSYKLSYLFYEFDAVTFTMTLSGNLTTDQNDKDAKDNSDDNQIPYTVKVASKDEKNQGNTTTKTHTATTLDSSDPSNRTWTTGPYTATTKLGDYVYSTLDLTISPKYSSDNTDTTYSDPTLKGKVAGKYTSTITLTVTVA